MNAALMGQFLAPQRIVVGLSITQTFSYFDNVDEEIDLEADPILNQVTFGLDSDIISCNDNYFY